MSVEGSNTQVRLKSGIEGLDDVLHGGFTANRFYLIDGEPGSGKTTLALKFLLEGIAQGERCLYVTLSETREEIAAVAASHGWNLNNVEILELMPPVAELDREAQVTMYAAADIERGEVMSKILEVVEKLNPSRVVFDSLSELRLMSESVLRYRRQIIALKQFFTSRACTVMLLNDRTTEGTDNHLQSISHGVILLEQFVPAYGGTRRRLRVLKNRATDYRSGYHDFAIRYGGLAVFPRLVAAEHAEAFAPEQIQSGVSALDQLLGGGQDRGTSTLFIGPPGSGKSTIAVQYAVTAAVRGDHAVIFAFDESTATLQRRMTGLGIEFKHGVAAGEIEIRQVDPAEVSPGEFAHMVRRAVERDNARVVVIDSLNGYLNSMPEEKFLTAQLHELLSYLNRKGVTTLLVVAQHGIAVTEMHAPVDISYLADSVVIIRFFEHAGTVKKAISVPKKRSGNHESTIRELRFDRSGIHISEPLTQLRGVLTGVPWEIQSDRGVD